MVNFIASSFSVLSCLVILGARSTWGRGGATPDGNEQGPADPATTPAPEAIPDEPPVTTDHVVSVGGRELRYRATVGFLPIHGEDGAPEARLFFTAYTLDRSEGSRDRPLMVSFNGGPGSSSVWLHLGGLGPKRVAMLPDGAMPPPPFRLVDNDQTWLESTDLVFVDPIDTGYSRARTPEIAKRLKGVEGDVASIGQFVRLYLSRYQRWASPLFLVGESYGTFRAAALAGHLIERGIAFNGIVFVSSVLDLLTLEFHPGNDLPYPLILPTYAAIAWFHRRLKPDLQALPLADLLAEVEAWAIADYVPALARGHVLSAAARSTIAERLARYTGLPPDVVEQSNLRIEINRFRHELLRDEGLTVGRLDGRYTGRDPAPIEERRDFDPSLAAIRPPFTATLNDYLRTGLGHETDQEYQILRGLEWDWGSAQTGYPKSAQALTEAFAKNPYLRLFVASGWYDLATPSFATDYTLDHLPLGTVSRDAISVGRYPVGHMVYLEEGSLAQLKRDVTAFISGALAQPPRALRPGSGSPADG